MLMRDRLYSALKRLDAAHRLGLALPALAAPLRLLSHAAYRGLEVALGDRHPHGRVLAQARTLMGRRKNSNC